MAVVPEAVAAPQTVAVVVEMGLGRKPPYFVAGTVPGQMGLGPLHRALVGTSKSHFEVGVLYMCLLLANNFHPHYVYFRVARPPEVPPEPH